MNTFLKLVEQILEEDNSTASVGMGATGTQISADTYNTGDNRIAKVLGGITRRTFPPLMITNGKKRHKKSKKKVRHHKKK